MLNLELDIALDRLAKTIKDVSVRIEIILLEDRVEQLELRQQGTKILESMLGHTIGD